MKPPPLDEPADAPLQKFWWLKRLSLLAATLILLIFLSRAWMIHSENRRLNAEIERWKQAGLPILPGDFETPPVPDDQNAAVAISLAAMAVVENKEWLDTWEELEQVPLSANARRVADEMLVANAQAIKGLRRARNLTQVKWQRVKFEDILSGSTLDYHQANYNKLYSLTRVSKYTAIGALDRGNDAGFIEALADVHFISRTLAQDLNASSYGYAVGIERIATDLAARWVAALKLSGTDGFAARTRLTWLIHEWTEDDGGSRVQSILACEAEYAIESTQATVPPKNFRFRNLKIEQIPTGILDRALWRFFLPQRFRTVSDNLVEFRSEIEKVRGLNLSAMGNFRPSAPQSHLTTVEPLDSIIEAIVPTPNDYSTYFRGLFRGLLTRRLAATSMAWRLYAIDHDGNGPATLKELVPKYLPAVPLDPFSPSGAIIQYVHGTGENGTFVYGLNEWGIDAIANGTFKPKLKDHMKWHTKCIVTFFDPNPLAPATQPASTQPLNQ